jgi:hypothetical protein
MSATEEELSSMVIAQDWEWEAKQDGATEGLAKHRWHWTLDESNPKRVSIRSYARQVERGETTIRNMVNGYADWIARPRARTLSECIERAKVGTEKAIAIEAVAQARDITFKTAASSKYKDDVRWVRDTALEEVEKGKEYEKVALSTAKIIVKNEEKQKKADRERREEIRAHPIEPASTMLLSFGYILKKEKEALKFSQQTLGEDYEWDEEQREILLSTLERIKALSDLLVQAIEGIPDIDWDAEFAKLGDLK